MLGRCVLVPGSAISESTSEIAIDVAVRADLTAGDVAWLWRLLEIVIAGVSRSIVHDKDMFGFKSKKTASSRARIDVVGRLRPELSRDSLGVGPDFPGIAPNPSLNRAAVRRAQELRVGSLAVGELVSWHEIGGEGKPRVVLVFDVRTEDGVAFRAIADETMTVTAVARLAPRQNHPVRYRPAIMDHCVALAEPSDVPKSSWVATQIESA